LHYNWNRYYDPATGRYLTADPIGLDGGMNLYLYAGANPINAVDPTGLVTGVEEGIIGGTIVCGPACGVAGGLIGLGVGVGLGQWVWDKCNDDNDCQALYAKIEKRISELKKRYSDLILDKYNLPETGPMSKEGHRQQFMNKQQNLRSLLNEANSKGCTGYRSDAWHWATIDAP